MSRLLSRRVRAITILLGTVASFAAVPGVSTGSLPSARRVVRVVVPRDVSFREDERGFVASVWVNSAGPFSFAIDTGAGMTVVSKRVASEARLEVLRSMSIAGLSGRVAKAYESAPAELAAGSPSNRLPRAVAVTISDGLPAGVDGLLDPSHAFWPLGFTMDFPRGSLRAFDPVAYPIAKDDVPEGGTVTGWLMRADSRRPFVALDGGRTGLLDTGSKFGLALGPVELRTFGVVDGEPDEGATVRDVGGGTVTGRRTTVARVVLGGMVLENVPTDVLTGVAPGTPILLGRDLLRPFVVSFDPRARLIRFALR